MEWWKNLLRRGTIQTILWLAVGVILLVWPDSAARALCYLMGAVMVVLGVVQCVGAFQKENGRFYASFNLLTGVLALGVGLWSLISPDTAKGLLPVLLAIVMLMHGVQDCVAAWRLKSAGYEKWWVGLLLGLITLAAGVLVLCNPGAFANFILRLTGFLLLYDAVTDLWILHKLGRWTKEVEKSGL